MEQSNTASLICPDLLPLAVEIASVKPDPANAREGHDLDGIAASLQKYGQRKPIVVNRNTMVIEAGNGTFTAAKALGWSEIAAVMVDDDPMTATGFAIADNRLNDISEFNNDTLSRLLDGFEDPTMIPGISTSFVDDLMSSLDSGKESLIGDDELPETLEEPITQPGDLWVMGDHRLICGDATDPTVVAYLMEEDVANLIVTDPPYNVNVEGHAGKIKNDHMADEEFYSFLSAAFVVMHANIVEGGSIYVAHADTEGLNFRKAFKEAGFKEASCLIWKKNHFTLSRSDYQWQHEPVLYGWRPGAAHSFYGGRKLSTIQELEESGLATKISDNEFQIPIGEQTLVIKGDNLSVESVVPTIHCVDKPTRSDDHPTMKPVALLERFIRASSQVNEVVLDPFGGSGSTLIACEKTSRQGRLVELDPKFADVIVKRWEAFTGKNAERFQAYGASSA